MSLTAALSNDGGRHFNRYHGDRGLIANLPYRFKVKRGEFIGFMNPSNVVERSGLYYVLVTGIDPYDLKRSGVCLLRTASLSDPTSWRAWNGNAFATRFANPYRRDLSDPSLYSCTPICPEVLFLSLGSVAWSQLRGRFLMVMRLQAWDRPIYGEKPGAYLFESEDLINWTGPTLLLSDEKAGDGDQLYPSLIDPDANDQNFGTIGPDPLLFTKIATPGLGYSGWKLQVRKVKLQQ